ncbi:MAG TPA: hypothetical protein VHR41_08715 [Gemmatimonadales bacterium]|nr:hypothetical protein [Gemmatimonadales bacterium]
MPASSAPARLLLVLLLAAAARPASAGTRPGTCSSCTVTLVHDFWALVSGVSSMRKAVQQEPGPRPRPQAIAPAQSEDHTVDISDLSKPTVIESKLRRALRTNDGAVRLTVPSGTARLGDFSVGSNESVPGHLLVVDGTADVYGKLMGNLVTVDGDVVLHPGGLVSGDILTLGGEVRDQGGEIGGEVRSLRAAAPEGPTAREAPAPGALETVFHRVSGVVGVFLTLGALGFGLVLFGRPNLEVVSDTVSHSFGRAFVTGLVGQILLLPTFGMLVVGLVLSVAGILLLPFAVVVYGLLVVVGALGGYLAVAHAMGETYTRRRLAQGMIGSPNSYRYLLVGLGSLAAFWLAWALFGWVPVAGNLIRGVAFLVTWLLATAGFGAALLSRAGIRENFAGRLIPPEALTDEYLWATPQFGVTAARRPGGRTPTRGL